MTQINLSKGVMLVVAVCAVSTAARLMFQNLPAIKVSVEFGSKAPVVNLTEKADLNEPVSDLLPHRFSLSNPSVTNWQWDNAQFDRPCTETGEPFSE